MPLLSRNSQSQPDTDATQAFFFLRFTDAEGYADTRCQAEMLIFTPAYAATPPMPTLMIFHFFIAFASHDISFSAAAFIAQTPPEPPPMQTSFFCFFWPFRRARQPPLRNAISTESIISLRRFIFIFFDTPIITLSLAKYADSLAFSMILSP